MTGKVTSSGGFGRRMGWLAVGVALVLTGQVKAEPFTSRFHHDGKTGGTADFAVADHHSARAVVRKTTRRRPQPSPMQALRKAFLREHGVETMTLFFGYFGAFMPPPPPDPLPPTPPSPPPFQMPPPAPVVFSTSGASFLPPYVPQSPPPSQAPEPATLVMGLLGAGLTGFASWRKRRRKRELLIA